MAVWTLANTIDIVDTALTVSMLAHEVNSRQIQLALAMITSLLVVEINRCLFHLSNLLLAIANLRNFLVFTGVVLVNALLLSFKVFEKERFDDAERQFLIRLENLKDEQW